jgi:anthranilate phosphoribosyltransferase
VSYGSSTADVLEALGAQIVLAPAKVAACLRVLQQFGSDHVR